MKPEVGRTKESTKLEVRRLKVEQIIETVRTSTFQLLPQVRTSNFWLRTFKINLHPNVSLFAFQPINDKKTS